MTRPSALDSVFGWVNADNMAWLTDLYELTMADSMFRQGRNDWATYDLFVRRLPHGRAFLVAAGLAQALAYLQHLRFSEEALAYLRLIRCMTPGFIDYLRNFRFDVIKIDRSFVSELQNNQDDITLIRAIISIARDMSLLTIAEGVETAEQQAILNELGCCLGQGFHFSRPVPGAEMGALIANQTVPTAP